jgi:hypothetical protein
MKQLKFNTKKAFLHALTFLTGNSYAFTSYVDSLTITFFTREHFENAISSFEDVGLSNDQYSVGTNFCPLQSLGNSWTTEEHPQFEYSWMGGHSVIDFAK